MAITTPFQAVHEQLKANFAEYDGWDMPSDFGDSAAELKAVSEHCVAFDLSSFGRINISGTGCDELIEKVLADKTGDLEDGKWVWAIVTDSDGELVDTVRAAKTDDKYTIFTSPAARYAVADIVKNNAGEDVLVDDITEKTGMLGLYGPDSAGIVEKILPFDISEITAGRIDNVSFFMMTITIIRGSWASTEGFEVMCPKGACSMAAMAVGKYRDRENIVAGGMESLNTAISNAKRPFSIIDTPQGKKLQTTGV
jgi:aminomethyltransferase